MKVVTLENKIKLARAGFEPMNIHIEIVFVWKVSHNIPHGLMARILGFHPRGPGSIPGVGEHNFCKN